MSEIETNKDELKDNKLNFFANNLKSELMLEDGGKIEKNNNSIQINKDDSNFDLTVSDCLDLLGDDLIKDFLNLPEKTAVKLAAKNLPIEIKKQFINASKINDKFSTVKLNLAKKIVEKYGGNLDAKVSPELALLVISGVSVTLTYTQVKFEADKYLSDLSKIEGLS